ncbi:armadillo repeat-containing protein 10-like isoform X2 [Octodon degus]|uniref:Armadillo repeat-containing protein 10-like isoform X2 n=1 Tax=Octodon degus TaxID=10160 RepID=A0A6P6EHV8_OCTDE|nr:armadillo repeat-containing protein 10-like isoform X2 [Octodon degus]
MGGARAAGWVAAGLALGEGAGFCLYRVAHGPRHSKRGLRSSEFTEDLPNGSYDDIFNAEQLQKLLYLLESTEDPVITERALVTLGNSAAFSGNQAIIRELGGIPIVGNKINSPNHSIKEKALNALNNLSVNVENQGKIKVFVHQVLDLSFLSLFDGHTAQEILLRVLTLFQNINNCLQRGGLLAIQPPLPTVPCSPFYMERIVSRK